MLPEGKSKSLSSSVTYAFPHGPLVWIRRATGELRWGRSNSEWRGSRAHANGFIPFLRRPANVPVTGSFKPIITEEMHQRYWRRARERTASGASGLRFPHFMAGALHPGICCVDTVLANIPFSTGYSLERWQTGLNVRIPKKSGNFNVEKLRTILLFEADCNQNNKHLGRMMMQSGRCWRPNSTAAANIRAPLDTPSTNA